MVLMGFRSIYSQEVNFDNPTFMVGHNGSGKSNFADAFAFLSEAMVLPAAGGHRAAWRAFCSGIASRLGERPADESHVVV